MGVGYEWNVIALTPQEHAEYHNGGHITVFGRKRYTHKEFETLMRNHLILTHENWSEEKCKVHKGWEEENYGIKRKDKR